MARLTPQEKFNRAQQKKWDKLEVKGKRNTKITAAQGRGATRRRKNKEKDIDDSFLGIVRLIFRK